MPIINLQASASEKKVETPPIPETTSTAPSTIFYTLHKAGSVYFWSCIRRLATSVGMPGINIAQHYFKLGYSQEEFPAEAESVFKPIGYCYGPFRELKLPFEIPEYQKYKKLFITRDPRDILVSHYFSNKFSHPAMPPKTGEVAEVVAASKREKRARADMDIDTYVLHLAPRFLSRFQDYQAFITKHDVPTFRYEDIIDNFELWLHQVAKVMVISPRARAIRFLVDNHVADVKEEDVTSHRRQMRPGDHVRKLKPETIGKLNEMFRAPLAFFQYPEA